MRYAGCAEPTHDQDREARESGGTELHFEIQLLRLLSTFLGEHPHPAAADWSRLVGDYPAHEAAIIEFALRYAAGGRVSAAGLPSSWLQVNA
jgi:hypothetical protein